MRSKHTETKLISAVQMWTMVAADPGEYNNYEFRDHGFCFAMSIQVHTYMNTNLGTHLSSFLALDMDLRQIQR